MIPSCAILVSLVFIIPLSNQWLCIKNAFFSPTSSTFMKKDHSISLHANFYLFFKLLKSKLDRIPFTNLLAKELLFRVLLQKGLKNKEDVGDRMRTMNFNFIPTKKILDKRSHSPTRQIFVLGKTDTETTKRIPALKLAQQQQV